MLGSRILDLIYSTDGIGRSNTYLSLSRHRPGALGRSLRPVTGCGQVRGPSRLASPFPAVKPSAQSGPAVGRERRVLANPECNHDAPTAARQRKCLERSPPMFYTWRARPTSEDTVCAHPVANEDLPMRTVAPARTAPQRPDPHSACGPRAVVGATANSPTSATRHR
jgi:hypothetical protein